VIYLLRFLVGASMAGWAFGHEQFARIFMTGLVWELAILAVYLFNGVMDVDEDRINGSRRPIARGDLPLNVAAAVSAGCAIVSLLGGLALGGGIAWAVTALLVLGFLYSAPPAYLKRHPIGSAGTGMSLGLLTYYAGLAGAASEGWGEFDTGLPIFGAFMSLWMGLVGTPAKDLSDVVGDVAAGRRPWPAVLGESTAKVILAVAAWGLAVALSAVGFFVYPLLIWPGAAMIGGAAAMSVVCLNEYSRGSRSRRRRPYRVFMTTQYVTNVSVFLPLTTTFLSV
jgi:4-hydroxybenzoate polyprenyltransferase